MTDPAALLQLSTRKRTKYASHLNVTLEAYDAALRRAFTEGFILGEQKTGPAFGQILREESERLW